MNNYYIFGTCILIGILILSAFFIRNFILYSKSKYLGKKRNSIELSNFLDYQFEIAKMTNAPNELIKVSKHAYSVSLKYYINAENYAKIQKLQGYISGKLDMSRDNGIVF